MDLRKGVRLFSDAQVAGMRQERAEGASYPEIAREWGTTKEYVWRLVNRTRRGT